MHAYRHQGQKQFQETSHTPVKAWFKNPLKKLVVKNCDQELA